MRESEQNAQAIIKTALDAFFQTDLDGVILEWGPQAEALTGWTRKEAIGANVVDLLVPERLRDAHRQRRKKMISEELGKSAGTRFEASAMHRDGREFPVEVSATALRRGDSYVLNNFLRDISQKRLAEEQLIQAQKMEAVGQLTGGIAHEFNNMLTVITGTIEILADGVKGNPHLAAIAKLISDAADRGARLTQVCSLSPGSSRCSRPRSTSTVSSKKWSQLLSLTFGKHIDIVTDLADDAWPALVDRAQLSSALVDLAINARDAMEGSGTLTLATSNVAFGIREAIAIGVERAGDYVVIESAIPAPASRHPSATRFSIHSFRPRKWERAPGWARAWCSASSSNPAAASRSAARTGRARPSGSTCRRPMPVRCLRGRDRAAGDAAGTKPSSASRTTARSGNSSPSS